MVRVALNPSDERFDVHWIFLNLFVSHLFETPFGKLSHSIAAELSQRIIVFVLGSLNERV